MMNSNDEHRSSVEQILDNLNHITSQHEARGIMVTNCHLTNPELIYPLKRINIFLNPDCFLRI